MVKGSDGETCCRLLLLEATSGSLAEACLAWPAAEVFKRSLSETQGVADQISREKIQIVFSDLSGAGCPALNVLSQIRRVHPQLPLVAILPEALSRVLENHDIRIQEMNLDLHVDFPEDLLPVWADQDKLELLFDGLVDNAVKFNRQGGRLSVTAGNLTLHGEPALYLRISNQGETVPRESAEDIFQEYSQLGELDTGKPTGIGVGLATCRAILRQMQGEIFLEPNEEGTSIGLLLPTRMELNNG